jgi:hypothetical protein
MSQNVLNLRAHGRPLTVITGWDNPLQEIFCHVWVHEEPPHSEADDADGPDFSALALERYSSARHVAQRLREFGIALPAAMLRSLEEDIAQRTRNVVREFDVSGARLR